MDIGTSLKETEQQRSLSVKATRPRRLALFLVHQHGAIAPATPRSIVRIRRHRASALPECDSPARRAALDLPIERSTGDGCRMVGTAGARLYFSSELGEQVQKRGAQCLEIRGAVQSAQPALIDARGGGVGDRLDGLARDGEEKPAESVGNSGWSGRSDVAHASKLPTAWASLLSPPGEPGER